MQKVVKFGGSSLADSNQFKKVKNIIESDIKRSIVVVSALGKRNKEDHKITDLLYLTGAHLKYGVDALSVFNIVKNRYFEVASDLGLNINLEEEFKIIESFFSSKIDEEYLVSRGEFLAAKLMANYLGFTFIDAANLIFFDYDGKINEAKTYDALQNILKENKKIVVPGFYGSYPDGKIHLLSRGGSDVTGSILAKASSATIYENWTDVSGFLLTDPRIVKNPPTITTITYKELRELAYMGATVLHGDAILPVCKSGIPINIRNTNKPEDPGTMIVESTCKKPEYTITGIAGKKGFVSINIEKDKMNGEVGFGSRVLQAFEQNGISFEHMPTGIDTLSVFVHQAEFEGKEQKVLSAIHRLAKPDSIDIDSDLALVAVVGRGMKSNRGVAARVLASLAHKNVNIKMIDQGSSELNIILGVDNKDFETAIQAIYDIFVVTCL